MTLHALLNTLAVGGFRLSSDGVGLELTGPLQRLSPELRQSIRDNKDGLLQLLPVSYEAAERYAIQHEATAPPEGDDWPEAFTWQALHEAAATGIPPKGWQFIEPLPEPKLWPEFQPLARASIDPYNERDADGQQPADASIR